MSDRWAGPFSRTRAQDLALEPVWTEIFGKMTAFRQSLVIIAAAELGYFDVIDRPESRDEIAQRLKITPVGAAVIVNALAALALVEQTGGHYRLRRDVAKLFRPGSGYDIRYNIVALKKEVDVWSRMAGILTGRSGRDEDYTRELFDGRIRWFEGLGLLNRLDHEQILPKLAGYLPPQAEVLDVGGGEGYYAKRLCEETSLFRIDILDIPTGFSISEEINADRLAAGRVRHLSGDARELDADAAYDVVLLNELLELFEREEKRSIFQRAAAAVRPGGWLVVTKFPLTRQGTGPGRFPLFSVRMHMKFTEGYLEADDDVIDWALADGLSVFEILRLNRTTMVFQKRQET
ncbi:MAG: class I SAM-dependent methyltransferase [Rhodovibrio sp.]|nr:class I SAM-dependent methyltransferase [Rhodovibrio sp.]